MCVRKKRNNFQQFVPDEFVHYVALGLFHFAHFHLGRRQDRDTAPVIKGVGVHESPQGTDFGDVVIQELITAVIEHFSKVVDGRIALGDEVENLAPGGVGHPIG